MSAKNQNNGNGYWVMQGLDSSCLGDYLMSVQLARILDYHSSGIRTGWSGAGQFAFRQKMDPKELAGLIARGEWPIIPVVSPWESSTGHHSGEDRSVLDVIMAQKGKHWADIQETIRCADACAAMPKEECIAYMRANAPDSALDWIDLCWPSATTDKPRPMLRIIGTGGNFGRWSIARNYQVALVRALCGEKYTSEQSYKALIGHIWGSPYQVSQPITPPKSMGPWSPGRPYNPWALLLAVAGVTAFSPSTATRQREGIPHGLACDHVAAGGITCPSEETDNYGGTEQEWWMPLWADLTWRELREVLSNLDLQAGNAVEAYQRIAKGRVVI